MWWQEVVPGHWHVFGMPENLVRERYPALLAALEKLSTRGPMPTLRWPHCLPGARRSPRPPPRHGGSERPTSQRIDLPVKGPTI